MWKILFIVFIALVVISAILPSFFELELIWIVLLVTICAVVLVFVILYAAKTLPSKRYG